MNTNYSKQIILVHLFFLASFAAFSQTLSDTEIKRNIVPIETALQKLITLQPKTYEYDTKQYRHIGLRQGKQYGFIAEDIQTVFPELVTEKSTQFMAGKNFFKRASFKTVDEQSLIPLLVAAIKEQQHQIDELKQAIAELKSEKK